MRWLIITQKVDQTDPVLGFFVLWLEEFYKQIGPLKVICLQKGENNLPSDIEVFSLGKEKKQSRLNYVIRFFYFLWRERKNYDQVFVHMNQEYVLLAGWWWRLTGKKIFLWRNHPAGSFLTKIAIWLANKVYCTSKQSFTAGFSKTEIMPVGINTEIFKRDNNVEKIKNSILFLGRISTIKKPDILIEALNLLDKQEVSFQSLIVGDPLPKDFLYYQSLKDRVEFLGLSDKVKFNSGIKNNETIIFYNKHEIFVNLTPSGAFDKTIFEAMACETLVVTSNLSLKGEVEDRFIFSEGDYLELVEKLKTVLSLDEKDKIEIGQKFREFCVKKHSLHLLAKKIFNV